MQIYSIEITFVHYPNQIMIMFSVDSVSSDCIRRRTSQSTRLCQTLILWDIENNTILTQMIALKRK